MARFSEWSMEGCSLYALCPRSNEINGIFCCFLFLLLWGKEIVFYPLLALTIVFCFFFHVKITTARCLTRTLLLYFIRKNTFHPTIVYATCHQPAKNHLLPPDPPNLHLQNTSVRSALNVSQGTIVCEDISTFVSMEVRARVYQSRRQPKSVRCA